ncbi:hypothetical protein M3Y94_00035400 [Aphelenchoides besseyi]|nr:hypothetical protein M3Y94_00035400 [Aphelenchoides besseyi]
MSFSTVNGLTCYVCDTNDHTMSDCGLPDKTKSCSGSCGKLGCLSDVTIGDSYMSTKCWDDDIIKGKCNGSMGQIAANGRLLVLSILPFIFVKFIL